MPVTLVPHQKPEMTARASSVFDSGRDERCRSLLVGDALGGKDAGVGAYDRSGEIEFTRMLCCAFTTATDLVMPMTACLEAL